MTCYHGTEIFQITNLASLRPTFDSSVCFHQSVTNTKIRHRALPMREFSTPQTRLVQPIYSGTKWNQLSWQSQRVLHIALSPSQNNSRTRAVGDRRCQGRGTFGPRTTTTAVVRRTLQDQPAISNESDILRRLTVVMRKLRRLGSDLIGICPCRTEIKRRPRKDTNISNLIPRTRPRSISQIGMSRWIMLCQSIWMRWLWSRWTFRGVEHRIPACRLGVVVWVGVERVKSVLDFAGFICP